MDLKTVYRKPGETAMGAVSRAKKINADIVLSSSKDTKTSYFNAYPISSIAIDVFACLKFKELDTVVHCPAYGFIGKMDSLKRILAQNNVTLVEMAA